MTEALLLLLLLLLLPLCRLLLLVAVVEQLCMPILLRHTWRPLLLHPIRLAGQSRLQMTRSGPDLQEVLQLLLLLAAPRRI
jgi:hypothetical protein